MDHHYLVSPKVIRAPHRIQRETVVIFHHNSFLVIHVLCGVLVQCVRGPAPTGPEKNACMTRNVVMVIVANLAHVDVQVRTKIVHPEIVAQALPVKEEGRMRDVGKSPNIINEKNIYYFYIFSKSSYIFCRLNSRLKLILNYTGPYLHS